MDFADFIEKRRLEIVEPKFNTPLRFKNIVRISIREETENTAKDYLDIFGLISASKVKNM